MLSRDMDLFLLLRLSMGISLFKQIVSYYSRNKAQIESCVTFPAIWFFMKSTEFTAGIFLVVT